MAIFNSELLVCQRALTGMVGMIFPLYPHLGWLKKKHVSMNIIGPRNRFGLPSSMCFMNPEKNHRLFSVK